MVLSLIVFACFLQFSVGIQAPDVQGKWTTASRIPPQQSIDTVGPKPDLFWSYYDAAGYNLNRPSYTQGPYERKSPYPWKGEPMSRNFDSSKVMELGTAIKLAHGPRRRRDEKEARKPGKLSAIKDFLHIPLFCWKMIVNCKLFPRHICCPVMPKRTKRSEHYDPLFGIPVANPNNQVWKPYSPYYMGLEKGQPVAERRCSMGPAECSRQPTHPCCYYMVDRALHVGPLIQPSLLENWTSAMFEFGARNPIAFTTVKKVVMITMLMSLVVIWTWIGRQVGVLGDGTSRQDIKRIDEVMRSVYVATSGGNWMKDLQDTIKSSNNFVGVSKFLCCFIDENSVDSSLEKTLQCYPKSRRRNVNIKVQSALQCVSELMYEVAVHPEPTTTSTTTTSTTTTKTTVKSNQEVHT